MIGILDMFQLKTKLDLEKYSLLLKMLEEHLLIMSSSSLQIIKLNKNYGQILDSQLKNKLIRKLFQSITSSRSNLKEEDLKLVKLKIQSLYIVQFLLKLLSQVVIVKFISCRQSFKQLEESLQYLPLKVQLQVLMRDY